MLCYLMLRYDLLCYGVLGYVILCMVTVCYAKLSYGMLCHGSRMCSMALGCAQWLSDVLSGSGGLSASDGPGKGGPHGRPRNGPFLKGILKETEGLLRAVVFRFLPFGNRHRRARLKSCSSVLVFKILNRI